MVPGLAVGEYLFSLLLDGDQTEVLRPFERKLATAPWDLSGIFGGEDVAAPAEEVCWFGTSLR